MKRAKSQRKTMDDFLRAYSLHGRDVAVVGPNTSVGNDPSLLYFANRMAAGLGTLTVIDVRPHARQ
ncbi:hypothetical protein HZB03_01895, partial [Candidatus Woesearchaeota archaeon]|nr:hypothetical protein [Candidatus Woesearchaeota archaeon]